MAILLFDVNETLSDMRPLADRFARHGAPASYFDEWFAATLRDGFALSMIDRPQPFADVARAVLHTLFGRLADVDAAAAADDVLAGFASLELHADVAPAVRAIRARGHRPATLSNGAASVAEGLLDRAGLADLVEPVLSVDEVGAWKPDARAYRWAVEQCGVEPDDAVLVAVHPWDVDGARAAGLRTVFVDRTGTPYPPVFAPADVAVDTLTALPDALLQLS